MICNKCGKEINAEEKFCSNCGTPINDINNFQQPIGPQQPSQSIQPAQQTKKKSFLSVYKIMWVLVIAWSFLFMILSLVLHIIGIETSTTIFSVFTTGVPIYTIVTGWIDALIYTTVINRATKNNQDTKKIKLITLGALILVNIIIIIVVVIPAVYMAKESPIDNWDCQNYSWTDNNTSEDNGITLDLKYNDSFIWKDKKSNETVEGTHVIKENAKHNKTKGNDRIYSIELTVEKSSNSSITKGKKLTYIMQLSADKDYSEASLINPTTYKTYLCTRK